MAQGSEKKKNTPGKSEAIADGCISFPKILNMAEFDALLVDFNKKLEAYLEANNKLMCFRLKVEQSSDQAKC